MKLGIGLAAAALSLFLGHAAEAEEAKERMLAHDVYFTLVDDSPEAASALVAGCKKYLSGHEGVVWFAAGKLVTENDREVNDLDFDVALHLVFRDKAAHDAYQNAADHHKFIEEYRDNWKQVRVFDSYIDVGLK